ncbi:glycoside hydrolase family 28 protein [Chitinophaga niabensis]|uniref:Glycosyl hydrolases family 28 n=1 Tax=Chitinophaga niabensis TaxID=536979 RepID=A0A1N6K4E1_9BACT|nr:glycosyl hydrolase family 28 protein [Chitinophaga niabensis]SIO51186.1 Glycosyl hydrolases family 28 [Chitinophaga niabensis]
MTSSNNMLSRRNWLGFITTASIFATGTKVFGAPAPKAAASSGIYNIRDFGAQGDGVTLDTKAIQSAINTCAQAQGGMVLIPAGIFVTGTLELKSNVTLHIAAQGKILGTGDGKQYYAAEAIPTTGEWTMGDGNVGLIFAANAENISIEGKGTIDGQGVLFKSAVKGEVPPAGISGNKRPHHLLFYKCKNLSVKDIFLTNSAYHSVRVCVCKEVKLDGIRIHSRVIHNNDGFHFISSEHVHVSNCDVKCQDDACALFGSNKYVTITNCSFSTRWSVFRFGGGYSENITVSGCLIYETYGCPIKMRCDHLSHFENISFSNIIMQGVTGPVSIGLGPQRPQPGEVLPKPGIVKNISFNHIRATVVKPLPLTESLQDSKYNAGEMFSCIILNGMDEGFLENISFDDVHITFPGGGTAEQAAVRDVPKVASEYYVIGVPPAHGIFARNVKGLTMNNVRLQTQTPDLRPAMVLDHVKDAALNGCSITGVDEVVRCIDVQDVLFQAPRVLSPSKIFMQVEGMANRNIKIEGGDLSKVTTPLAGAWKEIVKLRD